MKRFDRENMRLERCIFRDGWIWRNGYGDGELTSTIYATVVNAEQARDTGKVCLCNRPER